MAVRRFQLFTLAFCVFLQVFSFAVCISQYEDSAEGLTLQTRAAKNFTPREIEDNIRNVFDDVLECPVATDTCQHVLSDLKAILENEVAGSTITGVISLIKHALMDQFGHNTVIAASDGVMKIMTEPDIYPAVRATLSSLEYITNDEKTPEFIHKLAILAKDLMVIPNFTKSLRAAGNGLINIINIPESGKYVQQAMTNAKTLLTNSLLTLAKKNMKNIISSNKTD